MRERDIRCAILNTITAEHAGDPDTLIIQELGLCEGVARVDVAVVNGRVHGYEIKSAQDTLSRLPGQAEVYGRALDLVTMVVDRKHVRQTKSIIPRWWGIIEAAAASDGSVSLRTIRVSASNPKVDAFAQAQLLWREEALDALAARSLDVGLRTKPRRLLWERLAEALPADELRAEVRARLKGRQSWRVESPQGSGGGSFLPSSM